MLKNDRKGIDYFCRIFLYRPRFWATNTRTLISKSGECMENVSDHKSRGSANMSLGNSVFGEWGIHVTSWNVDSTTPRAGGPKTTSIGEKYCNIIRRVFRFFCNCYCISWVLWFIIGVKWLIQAWGRIAIIFVMFGTFPKCITFWYF